MNYLKPLGLLLLLAVLLFLTFNRHSKSGYYNYHSEIWGDKAGYFIYLPATLKYDWNARLLPDSNEQKTGKGFYLDAATNRIATKYTYGVAFLQFPFYLLADFAAVPLGYEANGFSPPYHWCINIAAVFYLFIGLIALFKFLSHYFNSATVIITILLLLLGTNLYYYAIDETGMSHVYSFCLFSLFLYVIKKMNFNLNYSFSQLSFLGLIMGFIVLIRPTNIILFTSILFLDIKSSGEVLDRLKAFFSLKVLVPILFSILLVLTPQLLYWNYLNGNVLYYSYQGEGFNWLTPQFLGVWFAAKNGLFLYTPLYFIILMAVFFMMRDKKPTALFLLLLFFGLSYICSSWWDWSFGCALGARNFVEYLTLFSLPLAYLIQSINDAKAIWKILFYSLCSIFIYLNLKMSYAYDGCFYGEGPWDYRFYFNYLLTLLPH